VKVGLAGIVPSRGGVSALVFGNWYSGSQNGQAAVSLWLWGWGGGVSPGVLIASNACK
jgi:hypothetical protein